MNFSLWQEYLLSLSDKRFFEIMRLYLGEVKTPYNRQRLCEQLTSFLMKDETKNSIIGLIDFFDLRILTAILLIPNVTKNSLIDFFSKDFEFTEIFPKISNLIERLIIFTKNVSQNSMQNDSQNEDFYLFFNPVLKDAILPFLDSKIIFPEHKIVKKSNDDVFSLSPNLLAAFVSFLRINKISCKNDGTLKSSEIKKIVDIFGEKQVFFELLINSFVNLQILNENEKNLEIDVQKLIELSKLKQNIQYSLICVASFFRFSREKLRKIAQIFLSCVNNIPKNGLTKNEILQLAFILKTEKDSENEISKKSRFAAILEVARSEKSQNDESLNQNFDVLNSIIDNAIVFGLLQKIGFNEQNEELFVKSECLCDFFNKAESSPNLPKSKKVLNIDSIFSINLQPGLSLYELIPLTSFLSIKKFNIVAEFELTKKSATFGFDNDFTPEKIFVTLNEFTNFALPQNLIFNIEEWFKLYNSAIIYQGYVLKIPSENAKIIEQNPNVSKFIKDKICDGVYFLNIPINSDFSEFLRNSNIEFLSKVKLPTTQKKVLNFQNFIEEQKIQFLTLNLKSPEKKKISITQTENIIQNLQEILNSLELDEFTYEVLQNRIKNRLIINKNQLLNASVRMEVYEINGMDYFGKLHFLTNCQKDNTLVEIKIPSSQKEFTTIIGYVSWVAKNQDESMVQIITEPEKKLENLMISKITHIRKLWNYF